MLTIGSVVTYVDEYGKEHDALLTAIWGPLDNPEWLPSVNLLYVSKDEDRTDNYGRQILRASSVVNAMHQGAHGYFWKQK